MKLNPNKETVIKIREELKQNNGYCPCMLIQNEDTRCPCKNMRKNNECICGLYVKK